jgi:hypothetical protein
MERLIIKGQNNSGYPAKQYCHIARDEKKKGYETALVIKRLILVDKLECLDYLATGHFVIKRYKEKFLYMKSISIKLSTLDQINSWLTTIKLK